MGCRELRPLLLRLLLLLLLAAVAIGASSLAEGEESVASGAGGRGRALTGSVESQGNVSFRCSPSGPCVACQYSEKTDDKYHCSETGYRLPIKCVEIQDAGKEGITDKGGRKLLEDSSPSSSGKQYIMYRSCMPVEEEEKLSVLGFEVIMAGLLLICGPVIYFRQKRTSSMPGAGFSRVSTNSQRI